MQIEELPGLPGEPPYPVQIALPGVSTFREGYVLRISPKSGASWVGNFQMGCSYYSASVELHTNRLAVIAGGLGYVIDANRREVQHTFGGDIMHIVPLPNCAELLAVSNTDIERHSSTHRVWLSKRIAWDGIGRVQLHGNSLHGYARHFDDSWHHFELDLATGQHTGGAYPSEA